ncbi:MAG TPA: hypothetical protein VHJ19_05020 [Gammaproteobacteria bacterium]|nr:hypothetical protein [Gammaproteobacteria bacterium]
MPDAVYEQAQQHFDDQYSANLTMAVIAINGWNRLAVSLRWPAGNYQPKKAVRS